MRLGHRGTVRFCIVWKGKVCQGPARFLWRGVVGLAQVGTGPV